MDPWNDFLLFSFNILKPLKLNRGITFKDCPRECGVIRVYKKLLFAENPPNIWIFMQFIAYWYWKQTLHSFPWWLWKKLLNESLESILHLKNILVLDPDLQFSQNQVVLVWLYPQVHPPPMSIFPKMNRVGRIFLMRQKTKNLQLKK